MATDARIFVGTTDFAAELAPLMREADAAEVKASGGYEPLEALENALDFSSPNCWGVTFNGEPAAMFGVGDADGHPPKTVGIPWLLTGAAVERHPKTFYATCREQLQFLVSLYPMLKQYIDARHERALRWIGRLGFQVFPPIPFGKDGLPFHPVVLWRDGHV